MFEKAAIRGDIPESNIEEAYQRILRFKKTYCQSGVKPPTNPALSAIGSKENQELVNKINQIS